MRERIDLPTKILKPDHTGTEENMFEGLNPIHLLMILIVALLLFGPSKLGDLGKGLGDGIRHFKRALKDEPNTAAPPDSKTAEAKTEEQK
jgi:sec-independent protein translocase protein TatA